MSDIWLSGLWFCFWLNVPMAVDRSHRTSQSSLCWNSHFLIDRSEAYRRLLVNHVWLCILDRSCLQSLFLKSYIFKNTPKSYSVHAKYGNLDAANDFVNVPAAVFTDVRWKRGTGERQEERQRILFYSALSLCSRGAEIQQGDSFWLNKYAATSH